MASRSAASVHHAKRPGEGEVGFGLVRMGSRRLAAGCVGSGRGLTAGRSLGVATGPDPAPARPGAARLVAESWRRRVRHTSSAGRWLGRRARHSLLYLYRRTEEPRKEFSLE